MRRKANGTRDESVKAAGQDPACPRRGALWAMAAAPGRMHRPLGTRQRVIDTATFTAG